MSEGAVKAKVEVIDGVMTISASVDVVEVLTQLAAQSDNTIDDVLINFVKMARNNLDWKGAAIEYFKGQTP